MVDHSQMKLGKKPVKFDSRTLKLSNYLTIPVLPPTPKSFAWDKGITDWKMMMNDTVSCCTVAAAGHTQMGLTFDNNNLFTPNDRQIIASYSAITKYTPGHPETDNGAYCLDVLNYWHKTGIAGRTIGGFAQVNQLKKDFIKNSVALFGNLYVGVGLPITAQNQEVWDVPPGGASGDGQKYSWGGHAIDFISYNENTLTCITWGQTKQMTWDFFELYVDEAYVILSNDFLSKGVAPNGFDLATLQADLRLLAA